jgi:hypothetical protein
MTRLTTSTRSLWLNTVAASEYPALDRDIEVDVAVLGGGITGLTIGLVREDSVKTRVLHGLGLLFDRAYVGVVGGTYVIAGRRSSSHAIPSRCASAATCSTLATEASAYVAAASEPWRLRTVE